MPSIATYLRLRPAPEANADFEHSADEPNTLRIRQQADSLTQKHGQGGAETHYSFQFQRVFRPQTEQDEIFETVGKGVCERFLQGYNGTIFAYGQTGSGKTFTIDGGSKRFDDRGLLPRCLTFIYSALPELEVTNIQISGSYLEIYNDTAYDLLNAASGANMRLPKVSVQDRGTSCVVHGLSHHPAETEEVAQGLVFTGRTNRTVAATSMNMTSSRSHSIFTLHLSYQRPGSDTTTRAKLNLVDLAGSERASRSNAVGQHLEEAKHINLSLHYLEAVIIALQQKPGKGGHVPYRNSLLTKLLRDSLGGNCLTAMVATISQHPSNVSESISTCRFAQRVALVDNDARRNELLDDKTVIKRLRRRIAELQAELTVAQGLNQTKADTTGAAVAQAAPHATSQLSDSQEHNFDRERCGKLMNAYVHGKLGDPLAAVPEARALRYCFDILRSMILEQRNHVDELEKAVAEGMKNTEQLKDLKQKFGVTRAKMRNLAFAAMSKSTYGSKKKRSHKQSKSQKSSVKAKSLQSPQAASQQTARVAPVLESDATRALASVDVRGAKKQHAHTASAAQPSAAQQMKSKTSGANRAKAQKTLLLLGQKEQELIYALEDITDRVEEQRHIVMYCQNHAPFRLMAERMRERELEEDQAQVAAQLIEIQKGRAELEDALGQSLDALSGTKGSAATDASRQQQLRQGTVRDAAGLVTNSPPPLQRSNTFSKQTPASAGDGNAKSASSASQAQPLDPRLEELRQREEATRQKLAALKASMRESTQAEAVPPASHLSATITVPFNRDGRALMPLPRSGPQVSTPNHATPPKAATFLSGRTLTSPISTVSVDSSLASPAPAAVKPESERYMDALQQQKARVQRIRQAILAASTIQRAWRKYQARKTVSSTKGGTAVGKNAAGTTATSKKTKKGWFG